LVVLNYLISKGRESGRQHTTIVALGGEDGNSRRKEKVGDKDYVPLILPR